MAEERFSFPPAVRGTWAEASETNEIMRRRAAKRKKACFTYDPATLSVFNFSAFDK
jgi:hypothetical protein